MIEVQDHKEIGDSELNIEAKPKMCSMCDNCKIKKEAMDKDSLIFDDDVDINRRYAYLLYKYTKLLKDYVDLMQKHGEMLAENNKALKQACRNLGLEDDGK